MGEVYSANGKNGSTQNNQKSEISKAEWEMLAVKIMPKFTGKLFVGIKYVTSSADDKASLKNVLWKYVLGAVLVTGAVTIVGWIF